MEVSASRSVCKNKEAEMSIVNLAKNNINGGPRWPLWLEPSFLKYIATFTHRHDEGILPYTTPVSPLFNSVRSTLTCEYRTQDMFFDWNRTQSCKKIGFCPKFRPYLDSASFLVYPVLKRGSMFIWCYSHKFNRLTHLNEALPIQLLYKPNC